MLQVVDFLSNYQETSEEMREYARKVSITNLDRLIKDPDVRVLLGIGLKEGTLYHK